MEKTKLKTGDVLIFKAKDNHYKALICSKIDLEKSPHNYTFIGTDISQEEKPTLNNILQSQFFGTANSKEPHFRYSSKSLKNMWDVHPEIKPYHIGCYGFVIWRKDLAKFKEKLDFLGNIPIIENISLNGNGSVNASAWTFLESFFSKKIESVLTDRSQKKFKISAILKL